MLRIVNKLSFKKGCLNLITGPTGSGKTSLLVALLGKASEFITLEGADNWL